MAVNPQAGDHIVKSYDEELENLNNDIIKMGGLTEAQIARSIESVVRRDPELATRVIADDELVDDLNYEIDIQTTRLLALRQPMALDLRHIVAALKISADLERIADYAANISKRAITLSSSAPVPPVNSIPRMSRMAQQMVKEAIGRLGAGPDTAALEQDQVLLNMSDPEATKLQQDILARMVRT